MGELIFLTGPVRSGKSRRAVELAAARGADGVFVATYPCDPDDAEMAERVRRHRAERPPSWRTLEAPDDVPAALAALTEPPSAIVIDSIVLWAATRFHLPDAEILQAWDAVLAYVASAAAPVIIVGDEIGWSPVPMDASLRRFRDLAGWLGQRTATAATQAWLMVAGCPLRLK